MYYAWSDVCYGNGRASKNTVVYYSYTNNVSHIVSELAERIDADVIRIEPAEKGLDYAADNYAVGSAQIAAIRNAPDKEESYPAIDPVTVNPGDYDCVIIGAPLWWGNMAAPLQTFLFHYGKEMAGKKIGLIVSSASSGISGVESDAKRLVPQGDFLTPSLWIRSSQVSDAASMLDAWLDEIGYRDLASVPEVDVNDDSASVLKVFDMSGRTVSEMNTAPGGMYIVQYLSQGNVRTKKIAIR